MCDEVQFVLHKKQYLTIFYTFVQESYLGTNVIPKYQPKCTKKQTERISTCADKDHREIVRLGLFTQFSIMFKRSVNYAGSGSSITAI